MIMAMNRCSTREENILDLYLKTVSGQFKDIHTPEKLSDHDVIPGTLKISMSPIRKHRCISTKGKIMKL